MTSPSIKTAAVAGVGPGLGAALVRKFVAEGCRTAMLARSEEYLQFLADELPDDMTLPVPADLTDPESVKHAFDSIHDQWGTLDLLVCHASHSLGVGLLETTLDQFEHSWRVATAGAFLCCRQAVPGMLNAGRGAILFTGATSSIRGRGGAVAFSSAKFAVRGLAESLARELWPKGIHVAHIIIDGVINLPPDHPKGAPDPDETTMSPDHIAHSYWMLANQPRTAWSLELDLRPHDEEFFV